MDLNRNMLESLSFPEHQEPSTDSSTTSSSSVEGKPSNRRQRRRRHRGKKSSPSSSSSRISTKKLVSPIPDLTPEEQEHYVAIDCEMVGVGPYGCHSALARVTLLDWNGKVMLDSLVRPVQDVTDYRTFVSGITADDFLLDEHVMDFETCRDLVLSYIEDKIVIGHGLKSDFHALQIYNHPWYLQRDTAKYEPFLQKDNDATVGNYNHPLDIRRPKARKLKELVFEKLRRTIQPVGRVHDPIEDALGALDLYKLVRIKWEKCMAYKVSKTAEILAEQYLQQPQVEFKDITPGYELTDVSLQVDKGAILSCSCY